MKRLKLPFSILIIVVLIVTSCKDVIESGQKLEQLSLIPIPNNIISGNSSFKLSSQTKITLSDSSSEMLHVGNYLASTIRPATGFKVPVIYSNNSFSNGDIHLSISKDSIKLGNSGYFLNITQNAIQLIAKTPEGIFWGIQTLKQILPPEIERRTAQENFTWTMPTGSISDIPSYNYRSTMLDVSRHFFGLEDVKKYIDYMAFYKMNFLHLHLSDDQGWRIEIKKWPNLTKIGGSKEVGDGEGGFFTQEEFIELVNYAQKRYITIVPEIDMPGHTNAALASYAELNCDNQVKDLYTGIEVGFSTLCTRRELTYDFITDVINEIATISPGPFIHVGGDESQATNSEDYVYFIERVQNITQNAGKKMMGWDEIANTNLNSNSIVQMWNSSENARKAKAMGVQLILSPAKKTYLDMKYDSTTDLGLSWAGFINLKTGYDWNPANYIEGIGKQDILGLECPLWTETATNMNELEYLAFPRLLGYSEIGWSYKNNWEDYRKRLGTHYTRLKELGINFYRSKEIDWKENQ